MKYLNWLDLSYNSIKKNYSLELFVEQKLKELDLSNNLIENVQFLANFTSLVKLNLSNNLINEEN